MMYDREKSDSAIVAMKPTNRDPRPQMSGRAASTRIRIRRGPVSLRSARTQSRSTLQSGVRGLLDVLSTYLMDSACILERDFQLQAPAQRARRAGRGDSEQPADLIFQ
jgi:hypothetical protein